MKSVALTALALLAAPDCSLASSLIPKASSLQQHHSGGLVLRAGEGGSPGHKKPKLEKKDGALFGDTDCPCIGFDGVEGQTAVKLHSSSVSFPADLGARCEAWDNGRHPECKEGQTPGFGNSWCGKSWCFVDSCNCNLPELPKMSGYLPDARYQGKPIFWSYATCSTKDTEEDASEEVAIVSEIGNSKCRCIGFDGVPGKTKVALLSNGEKVSVDYPAEIGGTCRAWDAKLHPACSGSEPAAWCKTKWCYVDPCLCGIKESPKVTTYLPEATFTGKSLYYSYETCGGADSFTEENNLDACINQETQKECKAMKRTDGASKCAWTGSKCLGAELVNHPLCEGMVKKGQETEKAAAAAISGGSIAALTLTAGAAMLL